MVASLLLLTLLPLVFSAPQSVKRQYAGQQTLNQLIDGTPCRAITILFARGTGAPGNVGPDTGPPFFQAVVDSVGAANVAVQGVDYPANVLGFILGGSPTGINVMSDLVKQAQSQCPDTKLVLSGYSQGGQVVHRVADRLSADQREFVNSVVIFGDPYNGDPIGDIPSSKVLVICHPDDNICQGGIDATGAHLTYGNDAPQAAAFVVQRAGI